MKKKFISTVIAAAMFASSCAGLMPTAFAAANSPQYQTQKRQMEKLNRGLVAVKTTADSSGQAKNGVYLSWRLFGTEDLATQAFDIYKDDKLLKTTDPGSATCYIDTLGTSKSAYKVVPAGASEQEVMATQSVTPANQTFVPNGSNPYSYLDVPVEAPENTLYRRIELFDKKGKHSGYGGGINDASVGDLDGDGDYEIVLKWDPNNSKDAAAGGTTGRVYLDGYEIDPNNTDPSKNENNHLYKWRIDLGPHVRAGAHETPFLVYDFDGDGKSEIVSLTGPGAVDGTGKFVTEVGDTESIRKQDNTVLNLSKGKNIGVEYYTIFDGETGEALCTTEAIPIGSTDGKNWGKNLLNESQRYLAAVAYLDGVMPSIVMCRGYYYRAAMRAFTWDGQSLELQWAYDSEQSGVQDNSMYGQGNHNLSVGDIDNDGKDEIVYGSACLDDDGKTVLGNTKLGHGDAMHLSDFNNDGIQEVFSVKEDSPHFKHYAEDLRVAATGAHFWEDGKIVTTGDNGRGVMDNVDDEYAKTHPNALSIGWSSGRANSHDLYGNDITTKPGNAARGSNVNFLVYWDGDLGRELLDTTIVCKYNASTGATTRPATFANVTANNSTKSTPSLLADLWGDWREEIIYGVNDTADAIQAGKQPAMRIFTSLTPTKYRLATLMHDCQYRLAIAWQNIAYNQPPHTSYYIGSAALATDENGKSLNYLAPAVKYTSVEYPEDSFVKVDGVSLSEHEISVERSKTYTITATVTPDDAKRKGVKWSSSDESVAVVANGDITGIKPGKATITATTRDGGFTDTCEVEVWSNPVTGVTVDKEYESLQIEQTVQLTATVTPSDASDKAVNWVSSNPKVASVSGDGTVTAKSAGLATIYAVTVDGGFKAPFVVNVLPKGEEDIPGGDVFVTDNTDAETVFSNATATSASLRQTNATTGGRFYKTFGACDSGKATLSFKYVTGGSKLDGSNWNWTGHEYTFYVKVLGENGSNILTFKQPYTSSAGTLTTKFGSNTEQNFSGGWTTVVDGSGSIQGSAKRWIVTLEFDYDKDVCNATIVGTDSTWISETGKYTATFPLNGLKLDKLEFSSTVDGTGGITWSPDVSEVSYTKEVAVSGVSSAIYSRGAKTGIPWSSDDLAGWTQTNQETAALEYDEANSRIWYNPTKPSKEYSATKTFTGISDNGTLTYDIDWTFGSATGRTSVLEYLQFGDKLRIGWTSGYYTFVSVDGGTTYNGIDTEGNADATKSIFTGSNAIFTKNVKVVIDTATKTIKSFKFDGNEVSAYTNYKLPDDAAIDSVSFGLQRGGGTSDWAYPNGIDNIIVSQFAEGDKPMFPVSFINYDGKVLQEGSVELGTMPTYTGETPTRPADEKYTYTFNAWDPALTGVMAETIYRALYDTTPQSYTVELNTNGGTLSGDDVTGYTYGTEAALPTVTKEHYTFGGWCDNEACTGEAVTAIAATETGNKKYYAKLIPDTYTVTLVADGAEIDGNVTSYEYGTAKALPTTVTKTGYTFAGWYDNAECTGTAITEIAAGECTAKTYYAKFTPAVYNVTLNKNGGTLSGNDVTSYTYGTEVTLPTVTKEHYAFAGWYDNETCTGTAVEKISATDTGDKVYYAKLTPDTYNVTLVAEGALIDGNVTSYEYGTAKALPTAVTKTGYTFEGWYDNETCTGTAVTEISAADAGDKTYYAKLTPEVYTVMLISNGGTISGDNVTSYTYGTGAVLPTAVKEGYIFGGWYDNSTYQGTAAAAITAQDSGNKTYYARWTSDADEVKINGVSQDGKTVHIDFIAKRNAMFIGVLYDGNAVKEIKMKTAAVSDNPASAEEYLANTQYSAPIVFNNNINDYRLKVFMWGSMKDMSPLCEYASK